MIVYEGPGDIFYSGLQTLVCPVNCVGVMGAGLAKAFKESYRGLFLAYWKACQEGRLRTDLPFLFDQPGNVHQVLCFATKDHWKQPSQELYIRDGLEYLAGHYQEMGITSLSVPPLGCGLGGLDYSTQVRPLLQQYLEPLPIQVEVLCYK